MRVVRRLGGLVLVVSLVWAGGMRSGARQAAVAPQRIAPGTSGALQDWTAAINQMERDGSLRVRRVDDDVLVNGRAHEHLDQYYNGVRVFGADVSRQLQGAQVVSLFGAIYTGIDVDATATLSALEAREIVAGLSGSDIRSIVLPDLMILPKDTGGFALTYRAEAWTDAGPVVYFIDARTGGTIWKYNDLQTQSALRRGTGVLGDDKKVSIRSSGGQIVADDLLRPPSLRTYDMKGNLSRTKAFLLGFAVLGASDLATATSDPWTDGASVDAHTYQGWTYDYYFKRFGRRGLDNRDTPIVGLVHPVARETVFSATPSDADFYVNAFWDSNNHLMVYGDGLPQNVTLSGQRWNYLAGAIDVVAHELTHGVTQFTSNLIYQNESGALNESFSDMMGTSVEFFYQPVRGRANYLLGEDVVTPGGLRSMADPQTFGDPDHYSRRLIGTSDNGFVHSNSGIPNNAFYLAIEGGTNRTSGVQVTGVGGSSREQIEKVFYRAFTLLMPSNSTFAVARQATIQSARDLYGAGSAAERAVTQAWTAVGVN